MELGSDKDYAVVVDAGPTRTCIGCRTKKPDRNLVRVAVRDGEFVIAERGCGRGAWLCPEESCVQAAGRTKAFSRALRTKLADAVCAGTLLGWLGNRPPSHSL